MLSKLPGSRQLLAEVVLRDLADEARYERALARFAPDDDEPRAPDADPMSSAQSRRAMPV